MRQTVLGITAVVVCLVMQLPAQQSHPRPPLEEVLIPHTRHLPPVPANAPRTPDVVFDASALGSPVTLDRNWRVGVTANPAAAQPDYDDSTWAVRNAQDSFADVNDEDHLASAPGTDGSKGNAQPPKGHQRPYAWFRIHMKLAPGHGPIAMLLQLPVTQSSSMGVGSGSEGIGVEVFANGQPVQPEGPHADNPGSYQQISRLYRFKLDPSQTSLTLAVRTVYVPFGLTAYTGFFSSHTLRLGLEEDLKRELEIWSIHNLFERLPRLVVDILLTILAMFLLAMYFTQKGHIEYLWLALYELLEAPIGFLETAGSTGYIDRLWYGALVLEILMISAYVYFEFLVSFLALRKRWYVLLLRFSAPVLLLIGPSILLVDRYRFLGVGIVIIMIYAALWTLGWFAFIFITLISATLRRNFEAGLLLIPLILSLVGIIEPILAGGAADFAMNGYRSPLTIQAGPIPIHFASIADFTGIFVIVLIIFVRFLRIQRDQERASSELAAARSVQELMIPQEKQKTPGFEVDSIYNPANEVGGDFFHVQSTLDGGLLVVIGDVAGKGLKAAMNVSMLMGALRGTPDKSPARILESLNRVLVGSESFTTCQAAWFGANGELILANAGHLPPYLNSQEIALPGGLPLGVIPDVSYEEVRLYLHPGDRILLMSDGVVEAQQPSGELFGFDRVHNLSNQSAFYIADAAKAFGQEDDITVLTIRRLAQAMAA